MSQFYIVLIEKKADNNSTVRIQLFARYVNASPQQIEFLSNLQRDYPPERIARHAGASKL
jgi:hypothetical protein